MKTIWSDQTLQARPVVLRDTKGGLRFRYAAYRTSQEPSCGFSLYSEVGAPYQPAFAGFFEKFQLGATVDYGNVKPYIADGLQKEAQT